MLWSYDIRKGPVKLKDEHRTSNIELEKIKKQTYDPVKKLLEDSVRIVKPELLDDILDETDELIQIFIASIKTAEKKKQ